MHATTCTSGLLLPYLYNISASIMQTIWLCSHRIGFLCTFQLHVKNLRWNGEKHDFMLNNFISVQRRSCGVSHLIMFGRWQNLFSPAYTIFLVEIRGRTCDMPLQAVQICGMFITNMHLIIFKLLYGAITSAPVKGSARLAQNLSSFWQSLTFRL